MKRLACLVSALLCAVALRAQTTISYTSGENKLTPLTTTFANPLTLEVGSGSAQQSGAIDGTGSVTKTLSGTLTLTGANTYTGGTIVSAGTLVLGDAGAAGSGGIDLSTGGSSLGLALAGTVDNYIGGSGYVTVTAGVVTLTGANAYTGPTYLNGGIVVLGSGSALGSGGAVVFNGGTVRFTGSGTTDLSARINMPGQQYRFDTNGQIVTFANGLSSGSGTLLKTGLGTLILAGGVYTSQTTVESGTLQIGDGGTTGLLSSPATIDNGATLAFNRSDTYQQTSTLTNNGTLTLGGGGTLQLSTSLSGTGTTTIQSGNTLEIGLGGSGSFTNAITNNGALVATFGNVTLSGAISGSGSLAKTNLGVLTLTADNTYSGGTTVSAGTLQIGDGGNTGSLIGAISVASDATVALDRADGYAFSPQSITGAGAFTKLGGGTATFTRKQSYTGTTTVAAGTLQLGDGATSYADYGTAAGNYTIANGATLALNFTDDYQLFLAAFSGAGALTKQGAGKGTVITSQAYTGTTTIAAGTLELGAGLTGGTAGWLASSQVNILSGATFAFNRSDSVTYTGLIGGAGTLVKAGSGTLTLTGNSTGHSGGTSVTMGTLQLGDGGSAGWAGGGNIGISAGGTLAFNRSDEVTYAGVLSGAGALVKAGAGTLILAGANTFTGGTTIQNGTLQIGGWDDPLYQNYTTGSLTGNITNNATLVFQRQEDLTHAGNISGTGTLRKDGYGTLTLTGNNTYSGGTTLASGVLELGSAGALGSTGAITFNYGTLRHTAANTTDYSARFAAGDQSINIDTNGQDVTYASGFGSPDSSLIKLGAGTLALNGGNTLSYLEIAAGTLAAGSNAALGGAQFINLASGATLHVSDGGAFLGSGQHFAGSGIVSGGLTLGEGATLSPGYSLGTLTFTDGLTLNAGSILNFELGSVSDRIAVSGGMFSGPESGLVTLNIYDTGDFTENTYVLFDFTGASAGGLDLTDFQLGDTPAGYDLSLALNGSHLELVALAAVPEPSTWAALAGLAALGVAILRRRRLTPA